MRIGEMCRMPYEFTEHARARAAAAGRYRTARTAWSLVVQFISVALSISVAFRFGLYGAAAKRLERNVRFHT